MTAAGRSLAWIAALAIAASATPVGAAEFVEHYKAGLAAVESEDWDRVGTMMGRAIEIQPKSKARIKKALFFKQYLPHYYLGVSRYKLGDCAGALTAWQESEAQGVIKKFPEYGQLEVGRDQCIQHRTEVDSALIEAADLIAAAELASTGAWQSLESLQAKGVEGWESLSQRLQLAESSLYEAEVLFRQEDRDLGELQRSASRAAAARDGFDSISLDTSKWLQSLASEQVEMRAVLNQLVVASVRNLKATEYLEPYPAEIESHRKRVESLVAQVGGLDTSASNEEVGRLADQLGRAISVLERSAAGPPIELTAAAEAFLSGQYARVLEVLEVLVETERTPTKVSAQAHLLQAASLYALFHSEGGTNPALLDEAKHNVLSCQSVDKTVPIPSPKIFSPRFIEFFEAQRPWFLRT